MITRLYENLKHFIKKNLLWIIIFICYIVLLVYPLPYYIYTGGGIIDINDKINIEGATTSKGSLNMCYVSEIKATIPTYLLSYIFPSWNLIPKEDVVLNKEESTDDVLLRDKIYLEQANQSAILTAYSYANYSYHIKDNHLYVIYIEDTTTTDIKIGDDIKQIDQTTVNKLEDITIFLSNKQVGDKVSIKVINKEKEYDRYAIVKEKDGKKILGIAAEIIYDYETEPEVQFNFSKAESGSSGGLMLSIAIYDKLVEEDITKGLKISGTGTIEKDGKVGSIGGVKYKLKGAVDAGSDVFLVPNGKNYEECINLQKKYNYNIKIIGVDTFKDAITELSKID